MVTGWFWREITPQTWKVGQSEKMTNKLVKTERIVRKHCYIIRNWEENYKKSYPDKRRYAHWRSEGKVRHCAGRFLGKIWNSESSSIEKLEFSEFSFFFKGVASINVKKSTYGDYFILHYIDDSHECCSAFPIDKVDSQGWLAGWIGVGCWLQDE